MKKFIILVSSTIITLLLSTSCHDKESNIVNRYVAPSIIDVNAEINYANSKYVNYDIKITLNQAYSEDYNILVKYGNYSTKTLTCQANENVLTTSLSINKFEFIINYSQYKATCPIEINVLDNSENKLGEKYIHNLTYDQKPSIRMISVTEGETTYHSEDDSSQNRETDYSYKFEVNGALFFDDMGEYYYGNWADNGYFKWNGDPKDGTFSVSGGILWTSPKNTSEEYRSYIRVMGHVNGKQIEADKAVMFYWPSETQIEIVLIDSNENNNNNNNNSYNSSGTIQGHDYVDLGLSVKWATCNIGATCIEGYGDYYAWGETTTKSSYTEDNSKTYGKSMSDIGGNSSYDAATANWGSQWRLPTNDEFQELIDNCNWTWTTCNGVYGEKIVSKKNGNAIFLPAVGCCYTDSAIGRGACGYYWSSTPNGTDNASSLYFGSGGILTNWHDRCFGRSVRPVAE